MPILQKLKLGSYTACMKRLLRENNSNTQLHQNIFEKLGIENASEMSSGTYGTIYKIDGMLFKCIRFPEEMNKHDSVRKKIYNNRLFFQFEQEIHDKIQQQNQLISCPIMEPIVFGPLMIIRLGFLEGYITLAEFRKMERNQDYITACKWVVPELIRKTNMICDLGVFHGDHKANNVMINLVTKDLRIIDFGKAKWLNDIEKTCKECFDMYKSAGTFKKYNLLEDRKLCVFQNFYYSSILQYIFNEYQHKNYYKLFRLIDCHSVGLLCCHIFQRDYINDFSKSNSPEGRRQQFFGNFVRLFGIEQLIALQRIAGNNSQFLLENTEEFGSESYSTQEEEWIDYYNTDEQVYFSHELSKGFKLDGFGVLVSQRVFTEASKLNKTIENYLNDVDELVRNDVRAMLSHNVNDLIK